MSMESVVVFKFGDHNSMLLGIVYFGITHYAILSVQFVCSEEDYDVFGLRRQNSDNGKKIMHVSMFDVSISFM